MAILGRGKAREARPVDISGFTRHFAPPFTYTLAGCDGCLNLSAAT